MTNFFYVNIKAWLQVIWFIGYFLIWNLCYIDRLKIYFPNLLLPISAIYEDIRDLKVLDAAAFKKAVTSEGAWVTIATFARDIRTLRFALCKRSSKHIITNRFGQRITDIRRFYCSGVVLEDQRAFSRIIFGCTISDEEFVLLYDCRFSKNLEFRYEQSSVWMNATYGIQQSVYKYLMLLYVTRAPFVRVWKLSVCYFEGHFH